LLARVQRQARRRQPHLAKTQPSARIEAGFSPIVLALTARTADRSVAVPKVRAVPRAGTNLNLLWFLDDDPRDIWARYCRDAELAEACALRLAAPFILAVPGTRSHQELA
jgi:hypothetical protein